MANREGTMLHSEKLLVRGDKFISRMLSGYKVTSERLMPR